MLLTAVLQMNLVIRFVTENTGTLGEIMFLLLNLVLLTSKIKANMYMIALVMMDVQLVVRVQYTNVQHLSILLY